MQVTTVGLDLAKNIFHVHGVTETGEVAADIRELSKTHEIVSRSKTELWHRIGHQ